MQSEELTDLERELLERCVFGGHTTARLQAEMDGELARLVLTSTLRTLVARGLVEHSWASDSATVTDPDSGVFGPTVYEDDCWHTTDAGRAAVGLAAAVRVSEWVNPSAGPYRVPPLLAPWCAWRFRNGKPTLPEWYTRLTGTPAVQREQAQRRSARRRPSA
jgi:hypothetical protein